MVTGANSGVGFEVAQYLARRSAEVHLVCRSAQRGEEARRAIVAASGNSNVHLLVCDCGLESDVRAAWASFSQGVAAPRLDGEEQLQHGELLLDPFRHARQPSHPGGGGKGGRNRTKQRITMGVEPND